MQPLVVVAMQSLQTAKWIIGVVLMALPSVVGPGTIQVPSYGRTGDHSSRNPWQPFGEPWLRMATPKL